MSTEANFRTTSAGDISGAELESVHLQVEGISLAFGGQRLLEHADLDLFGGQVALLSGPNGCGKTTLLNILSGFQQPDTGRAILHIGGSSVDIVGTSPDRLARKGIARLWQDIRLFPTMSVMDNVLAASPFAIGLNPLATLFAWRRVRRQESVFRERALRWLDLLGMADRALSSGDKLSVGQSKRVAIARMLQTGAKVLLLDEPLAGLDTETAKRLVLDIKRLADQANKAILVVEHNHDLLLPVCNMRWSISGGMLEREDLVVK